VDKNTTVVFPAPLMSTIGELGSFLAREVSAANAPLITADSKSTSVAAAAAKGGPTTPTRACPADLESWMR